jgi:hypothetical protein
MSRRRMDSIRAWWRVACLILAVILLTLAFLSFPPIMGGIFGAFEGVGNIVVVAGPSEIEAIPVITSIKVRVLEADMGFSKEFMGNETEHELNPVRGALVLVTDGAEYFGFTNADGEVILSAPKGNFTLTVNPRPYNRDPTCFWRGHISVEGNETFVVKFFLYRLNPMEIDVNLRSTYPESNVTLGFKLPINGSYYVGIPVIVYYTPAGEVRLYREDVGGSIELGGVSRDLWRSPRINYLADWPGGSRMVETVSIRDFSAYILPDMTYLPVERVVLEELEAG